MAKQASKIPPPVAPKPTLKMSQLDNIRSTKPGSDASPERLNFSSKLQKFEREIEIKRPDRNTNGTTLPPPEKKPLLSEADMKKMKEEEAKKIQQGHPATASIESPEKDLFFDQLIDNSYMSPNQSGSNGGLNGKSLIPIRSKRAENRAIAAGQIDADEGLSETERTIREQQKRSEWRAARLKSLDQERAAADAVMTRLQMGSPLSSINETGNQANDRFLTNESITEKDESFDGETGTSTLTITQKRYTKREFEVGAGEIGFADD